jgi:hypothetical protein
VNHVRAAIATVALALVAAAPAAALTGGGGVSSALRGGGIVILNSNAASGPKTRTCQAGKHRGAVTNSTLLIGDKGKPGVVACEQPPRSSYSAETIAKATAAALAVIG